MAYTWSVIYICSTLGIFKTVSSLLFSSRSADFWPQSEGAEEARTGRSKKKIHMEKTLRGQNEEFEPEKMNIHTFLYKYNAPCSHSSQVGAQLQFRPLDGNICPIITKITL